jgi:hypothetical protein
MLEPGHFARFELYGKRNQYHYAPPICSLANSNVVEHADKIEGQGIDCLHHGSGSFVSTSVFHQNPIANVKSKLRQQLLWLILSMRKISKFLAGTKGTSVAWMDLITRLWSSYHQRPRFTLFETLNACLAVFGAMLSRSSFKEGKRSSDKGKVEIYLPHGDVKALI